MKFDIDECVFLNTGNKKQKVTKGENVRTTFCKFHVHHVIEKTFSFLPFVKVLTVRVYVSYLWLQMFMCMLNRECF